MCCSSFSFPLFSASMRCPAVQGFFPAPVVPTILPRSASTTRGQRAVVYSTSVDHLFYVSASARNDATLFVSVGSLFASPVFLEGPGELARARQASSHFGSELLNPLLQSAKRKRDNFSKAGCFSASSFAVANACNIFMVFFVISLPLINPCCALLS